jgi:U3 small nucleolar RNA-associated protein MPP10
MTEHNDDDSPLGDLIEILDHPEKRILPLLYSSKKEDTIENRKNTRTELVKISQYLFQEIEDLSKKYHQLTKKKNEDDDDNAQTTLSGLPEMYVPPGEAIDAETMWGQVDLQNNALNKLLKKSTKRLAQSPEDIVILDMGQVLSSDEDDSDEGGSDEDEMKVNSEEEESDSDSDEDDEEEDEEAKRIRVRMERAMADMDSDEDDQEQSDEDSEKVEAADDKSDKSEESLIDPAAEDLKDGFFDLNEMEDFADEEEDFLPVEAFGKPEKKKKGDIKKKSFHQQQRDGDFLNGTDDEDDEFEEEEEEPVERKKYREDDEIDALFTMYQQPKRGDDDDDDDEDEDDDDDIINMTAADMFGKPKKKHYENYYKKNPRAPKEDDDSWGEGEYDFENGDQEEGWRDEELKNKPEDSDEDDEEEEENDEEDKGHDKKKASQKKEDNSKHAKRAEKLRLQTEQLEKELLTEKPWQMTGESKSTTRPVNSLLEGTPEFQMASKQAPVITVEHTADLEEVIKKRILAEDWDDVVPRELPDVGWHKKRGEVPEVSQEKSKLGLGELYEREYLKKAVGYDVDAAEKQTEEDKAKDEMKQLFANLCSKLDALSNYHFAPRPIADEAEVRPVTAPAIAMEEVLPLHVSDARGVAPEEVYATKRGREGILRAESEMDQVSTWIVFLQYWHRQYINHLFILRN